MVYINLVKMKGVKIMSKIKIQYWSDFVKYVGNDADYNTIDSMTV